MAAGRGWLGLAGALGIALFPSAAGAVTPRTSAPREARVLARAFAAAARAIGPSVVRIEARDGAVVSGLIIDTDGNIVTAGRAAGRTIQPGTALSVVLEDGRTLPARVRGTDPVSGVAVVHLTSRPGDLGAARFGDSDLVEVGEWTLAIGRPLGLEETVSAGIMGGWLRGPTLSAVSAARGRGYFQTDATTAGAGAGGPLITLDGEVIGLCADGFAIPINQVRRVAQMIVNDGRAHYPYIGVGLLDVGELDGSRRGRLGQGPPLHGALVNHIWKGAPAARAGLRPGDVITTIDNQETPAPGDVVDRVSFHSVGEKLTVGFVRNGTAHSTQLRLDDLP